MFLEACHMEKGFGSLTTRKLAFKQRGDFAHLRARALRERAQYVFLRDRAEFARVRVARARAKYFARARARDI